MQHRHPTLLSGNLAAFLALAAFGSGNVHADPATLAAAGAVATVNGAPIAEETLVVFMQQKQSKRGGGATTRDSAVDDLIDLELLTQQAEREGITERPDIKSTLKLQRNNLLANIVLRERIKDAKITDEALKKEYDRQVAEMAGQEYKARHILVKEEADAVSIIEELDGGADFAELAREKSTGPSGPQGGDLGWFRADSMVPPFAAAVQAMEPGTYGKKPTKTQFGWHVILLEDMRDIDPPSFDTLKPKLRAALVNQWLRDYLAELRSGADIKKN